MNQANIAVRWIDGATADPDELKPSFDVRFSVFCDEQGYTPDVELDELDKLSRHILLSVDDNPVGTGRLFWKKENTMGLGRIALLKEWRGRELGRLIVTEMLAEARRMGAKRAELDSQCRVSGFYEKMGFHISGDEHMDGHVLHVWMEQLL